MYDAKPSRPQDEEELFNLRHTSARNIIERIFGVLKQCFSILVNPPHIDIKKQACLPLALAALHNFIRKHDPDDIADFSNVEDPQPGMCVEPLAAAGAGQLAEGVPQAAEKQRANERRGKIAREMWTQYQAELSRRNIEE